MHQKVGRKNLEQRSRKRKKGPVLHAIRHSVRFFRNYKQWNNRTFIVVLLASVAVSMIFTLLAEGARGISLSSSYPSAVQKKLNSQEKNADTEQETSARIMANGDILYHIPIYRTALKEDGTYDFHENLGYEER